MGPSRLHTERTALASSRGSIASTSLASVKAVAAILLRLTTRDTIASCVPYSEDATKATGRRETDRSAGSRLESMQTGIRHAFRTCRWTKAMLENCVPSFSSEQLPMET